MPNCELALWPEAMGGGGAAENGKPKTQVQKKRTWGTLRVVWICVGENLLVRTRGV